MIFFVTKKVIRQVVKLIETLKAGEVSAIDSKTGKVRVLLKGDDDKTTDWLNVLVP